MTIINTYESQVQNPEREYDRTQAVSRMVLDRMTRILRELTVGRDLERRLMGVGRTTIAWLETTEYIMPRDYDQIRDLIEDAAITSKLMHPGDTITVGLMYDMLDHKDGFAREHLKNVVVRIRFSPARA